MKHKVEFIPCRETSMPEGIICLFQDDIGIDFGIRKGDKVSYLVQKESPKTGEPIPIQNFSELIPHSVEYHFVKGWFRV